MLLHPKKELPASYVLKIKIPKYAQSSPTCKQQKDGFPAPGGRATPGKLFYILQALNIFEYIGPEGIALTAFQILRVSVRCY